jgi:hypothetical protein
MVRTERRRAPFRELPFDVERRKGRARRRRAWWWPAILIWLAVALGSAVLWLL